MVHWSRATVIVLSARVVWTVAIIMRAWKVYEILLCYRRRRGVGRSSFWDYWRGRRRTLAADLLADLGRPTYDQLRRASRINLPYLSIRLSRSWPFAALFSILRGLSVPPIRPRFNVKSERWDVVEKLTYASRDAAIAALTSTAGRAAFDRLWSDVESRVGNGAAVGAEKLVVRSDDTLGFPRAVTMFFLRPRLPKTGEEMLRYWRTAHWALVQSLTAATGHRVYDQLHALKDDAVAQALASFGGRNDPTFAGIAYLCYTNQWALIRRFIDPRLYIANTRLVMDEVGFIDLGNSALVFGQEERL